MVPTIWRLSLLVIVLFSYSLPAISKRHIQQSELPAIMMSKLPTDFAFTAQINVEGKLPFYLIELPEQIYLQSQWSDLRDIRVFNQQGLMVPFALSEPYQEVTFAEQTYTARVFPLKRSETDKNNGTDIKLSSQDGVQINVKQTKESRPEDITYLIDLVEFPSDGRAISRLNFVWPQSASNWQATARVYGGSSLNALQELVAIDVPLMDLSSGAERLKQDYIDIQPSASHRYWLLVLSTKQGTVIPEISAATAKVNEKKDTWIQSIELPFTLNQHPQPDSAEYHLLSPQPLSQLLIQPAQANLVLPVELYWRNSDSENWQFLYKSTLYSLKGKESNNVINLSGRHIRQIKLKAINSNWGKVAPTVKGIRQKQNIIFNAVDNGPFQLTWGAVNAQPVAMTVNELLQGSEQLLAKAALPHATVSDIKAQSDQTPEPQAAVGGNWQKIVIWCLLVVGVVSLLSLVAYLWRDLAKGTKNKLE